MPRPKRKTKAEDLARVRNNQRKSRERKRQHVTELEQKVKQLESAAAAAEESMLSMSLARENRMLRSILESIGVDSVSLEGYLRGAAFGGLQESLESDFMDPAGSVPGMGLVGLEPMSMPTDQLGPLSGNEPSSSISTADLFNPAALDFSYSAQTLEADRMPLDIFQRQAPAWNTHLSIPEDLAGVLHTLGGEASQSANSVNSETTLCSVAFNLIIQCNRTGKNVLELETRLRYAYKMPTSPGEGCRVDNETLLAVLAELVSDAGLGRYQDYLG